MADKEIINKIILLAEELNKNKERYIILKPKGMDQETFNKSTIKLRENSE